jgi:tetratricopeptide (TPR) repeat protein
MDPHEIFDPSNWILPAKPDLLAHIQMLRTPRRASPGESPGRRLTIDLTLDIHSVSLYCYLKSRFGPPNGVAMQMRDGGTHDFYHWHYTLAAGKKCFDVHSTQLGIEFQCPHLDYSAQFEDALKTALLADMARNRQDIGREKKQLEDWTVFVNPYQRLDEVVSGLEARASGLHLVLPKLKPMTLAAGHWNEEAMRAFETQATEYGKQLADAQTVGLSIKLIVPVWVESFINLLLFLLAQDKIKRDKRLFDNCFRQQIDVRVKMLPSVCKGFAADISDSDPEFRNFHKLFQDRNDLLHGNIDVNQLQIDRMFFDELIPLYGEWKSDYERRLAPVMAFIEPSVARLDIVNGSEFIIYLANKLAPGFAKQLWAVASSPMLGYRKDSMRLGILFDDEIRMLVPRRSTGRAGRPRSLEECEPPPGAPCLCGSGARFGTCCKGQYAQGHRHKTYELLAEEHFSAALTEARRYACWYSLCHQAHTKPLLDCGDEKAESLLAVDIAAMTGIGRLLRTCYQKAEIGDEFPNALAVLDGAIADPHWHSRIQALLADWWRLDKQNEQQARRALADINIDHCYDEVVLTCYLSVWGDESSPQRRIDLASRICELTEDASVRLNYSAMTSAVLLEQEDSERAIEILEQAIAQYDAVDEDRQDGFGDMRCAQAVRLLGEVKGDDNVLRNAAFRFQALIDKADPKRYTTAYFGDCTRAIGECHLLLGDLPAAVTLLQRSLGLQWDNYACILLAKAHLKNGDSTECRNALERIDPAALSEANHYDYAITLASLELRVPTLTGIDTAKALLKETKCRSTYFHKERDRKLIALLEVENQLLRGG